MSIFDSMGLSTDSIRGLVTNNLVVLTLLLEKGIVTEGEIKQATAVVTSTLDQMQAADREKARKEAGVLAPLLDKLSEFGYTSPL